MRHLIAVTVLLALAFTPATWHAPAANAQGAQPTLTVSSPANGTTITGPNVTVRFQTSGIQLTPTNVPISEAGRRPEANRAGEGHVHFMMDVLPLVVWDRPDAYTFTNVPPGEHQLMVEIVQTDHGPLATPVAQTIRFRTVALLASSGAGAPGPLAGGRLLFSAALLAVAGSLVWRWRGRPA
ncbi:MAG: hypothetical protein M3442_01150 [Chloroflexota bacterium]|nr:hypothetical protein [Chloroflexota bacterium]